MRHLALTGWMDGWVDDEDNDDDILGVVATVSK